MRPEQIQYLSQTQIGSRPHAEDRENIMQTEVQKRQEKERMLMDDM